MSEDPPEGSQPLASEQPPEPSQPAPFDEPPSANGARSDEALTGPVRIVGEDPDLDLDRPMTLIEHLEDLRKALIYIFASVILSTAGAFVFSGELLKFFLAPGKAVVGKFLITTITGPLMIDLEVSFVGGLVLSLPVVLWAVWGFLRPALKRTERRYIAGFVASAYLFFLMGGAFAYLVIPIALRFLIGFGNNGQYDIHITADNYLNFLLLVIVLFGVTFELPVVLVVLGMANIVKPSWLSHQRPRAWLAIALIAFVVTPGADLITPSLMTGCLVVFYEASIVVLRLLGKR
jgi:sec-independent protein translocase protein TatC